MGLFKIYPDSRDNSLESFLNKKEEKPFKTIEYEIDALVSKLKNVDNLNDEEIKNIIIHQHNIILDYDLFLRDSNTRKVAQDLFTNKRFLSILINIIGLLNIDYAEKICLNKLAYDYYQKDNKDQAICDILYQLTTMVNQREVTILSGIIGINAAKILSMLKNSSFRDEKCVRGVNSYIVESDLHLNAQSIVDIYYLFNKFGILFSYSMLETKPSSLTEFENRKFDNISIALISMLDSLTSDNILKVLQDYVYIHCLDQYKNIVPRFRLDTIKGYPRITEMVNYIKISEDLDIL